MNTLKLALASTIAWSIAACSPEAATDDVATEDAMAAEEAAPGTIVDVAVGDDNLSTLVAAVTAAELGDTLSGEGPFTVFAPNNEAFAKLPEGTVETLTTDDTETLGTILTYHVIAQAVDAASLTGAIEGAGEGGYEIPTVNGGTLTANVVDGAVVLTDAAGGTATITAVDVEASNGIVHVIDSVLMPQ